MAELADSKQVFVVTFPLRTEKWQEDRIDKILNLLTVLYHDRQKKMLDRYIHLSHSPQFKAAKQANKKDFAAFMRENGFTQYDLQKVFLDSSKSKSASREALEQHGINSRIIYLLSDSAWKAWDKKLNGEGKFIRLDNDVTSFKSRTDSKGNITGFDYSFTDFTITMKANKPKKHNLFTIPFVVNRDSEYEAYALGSEVRNIAIVRNQVRGKNKYYVQFTFAGTPYNKGRQMGKGIVGIDPGPSKVAVVSDSKIMIRTLAPSVERDESMTRRLQRKLDRSRRATNPDMYNEDGTIKRGIKLHFDKSNSYKRTQAKLADSQRKLAAKRKIEHNILANEIISMGNEFHVENNSFKGMQARTKETKKNAKGKNQSKKRFGKSLANRAPSEMLTILKNKINQYEGGEYVEIPASTACTQFDFTNGEFTKHELKERKIQTSDGRTHDRDALAAFNMRFVRKDKVVGKKKLEKTADNFDQKAMQQAYEQFCTMEKI